MKYALMKNVKTVVQYLYSDCVYILNCAESEAMEEAYALSKVLGNSTKTSDYTLYILGETINIQDFIRAAEDDKQSKIDVLLMARKKLDEEIEKIKGSR